MKNNAISNGSFIGSILKFSISSVVNFAIGIIAVIVTTRIFPPDVYGMINIFNNASSLIACFACLGMDGAFLRFFNEPPRGGDRKQLFAKCLFFSVLTLLFISLISLYFYYSHISFMLFNRVSLVLTIFLNVNSLSLLILNNYYSQYYRLANDSLHYTIQSILVQFFSKLFVIIAALFYPSIETVLFFNTVGLFFIMVIYICIQRRYVWPNKFHWSNEGFGEVFKYGIFGWPLTMAYSINGFLIPFLIKREMGSYALGIYASTGFFISAFNVVQNGFRTYWTSFMYAHYKDEQEKIVSVHNYIIVFAAILLTTFIAFQKVAYMLIGTEFQESRVFFSIVLIDPILLLIEQTTNYGMALAKKNQEMTVIYLFAIFSNLLLCYYILPLWGLPGVAIASAIAALIRFILSTWRGQIYYKSISDIGQTMIGVVAIISLGISNFLLYESLCQELLAVLIIWCIITLFFRKTIVSLYHFSKDR